MSSPQHEPTMEEILASIRKIISEDAPADAPAAAASAAPAANTAPAAPAPEADVLELTQEVVEPARPAPPPPPTPAPAPTPAPVDEVIFQPDPPASNEIFSDHTRKAMEDAFASIPDEEPEPMPKPRAAAAPLPPAGSSVESVFERAVRESFEPVLRNYLSDNSSAVVESMKPVIREWMDEYFPALLEGAIRAEVERVVKARGKR
jgi:cell pole-organizing protein PopZ